MRLNELLKQQESAVKQRWTDLIIATYPAGSHQFFKGQKNRFLNPVGAALWRQVEDLFALLLDGKGQENVEAILEDFVRMRAVQDYPPSAAIAYVLYLKQAIREVLHEDICRYQLFDELTAIEDRIDGFLLKAFDVYMLSRQKIYEIRENNFKRQSFLASRMMDSGHGDMIPENSDQAKNPDCGGERP